MKHSKQEKEIFKWFCKEADIINNLYQVNESSRKWKQKNMAERLLCSFKDKLADEKIQVTNKYEPLLPYLQQLSLIHYELYYNGAVNAMNMTIKIMKNTNFLSYSIAQAFILSIR